jgi:acetyl/propionyl-CoA carboxylase alpha subunit
MKRRFRKILIANRGEIALRIARTCREMGIESVAVYSDADRSSPHVKFADEGRYIGPPAARESHLNIERLLAAAKASGADAIHPGYGFLSENPSFAQACTDSGIEFIGPRAETILAMGDKIVARESARSAGLPVLAAYDGENQSASALREAILALGLPVMIKAAAGGGGRGMRIVRDESEIDSAISSAAREATRAFGDGRLFVERLIEGARHLEVQILGDKYGNLVHLFERDCSLQRRHQKVIEETPAASVSAKLRGQLHEMATALGRAIGYSSAGTVEFLVTPDETPFFIEVNARLQVEHPITEMVTGLDLVRLQIEVAEGHPLTLKQEDIRLRGHAIEARLYAEDPRQDFLPSVGHISMFQMPEGIEGLRIDNGVGKGFEVTTHYDGLLAKCASVGIDRADAIRKLIHALARTVIQPVTTNRSFLVRLLELETVVRGELDTMLIATHLETLAAVPARVESERVAVAIAIYLTHSWRSAEPKLARLPLAFRNNPYRPPSFELEAYGETISVSCHEEGPDIFNVTAGSWQGRALVLACSNDEVRLEIDGVQQLFSIARDGDAFSVSHGKDDFVIKRSPRFPLAEVAADLGVANSPMPGQVLKILVEKGQHVTIGQPLLVLEAMKMEQTIRAVVSGVVEAVLVERGAVVSPGDLLIRITSEERSAEART